VKFIKIKFFLIGLFVIGMISTPYISFAETQIQIQEGEINIEVTPRNPQPYQDVTIKISSYATDLNKAIITWQSELSTVLSGIGKTSYSFKTGKVGTSNIFDINITPINSLNTVSKRIAIVPSEIDIMWESVDGYTPPFYKGKSLPINGGKIKVVAIPNTETIKSGSGSISYTWKSGQSTSLENSGYNKNSYIFKNSMFDDKNEVTVIASSITGDYSAENTVKIPIYKPKIVFYKKSPIEGTIYNNALENTIDMIEDEITIVAEPYFISLKDNENNFSYRWQINDNDIGTPSIKRELTVRPESRGGYATISLEMENLKELFQKVSSQLRLNL
jgi:hypothetical protein